MTARNEAAFPSITMNASGQIIVSDISRPIPIPPPTDGEQPKPPKLSTSFASMVTAGITMLGFDFSKARRKSFLGLMPARSYLCVFYVINVSGVSQLCPPDSIQCW